LPPLFWTGKLSKKNKFLINTSNLIAYLNGSTKDIQAMKNHVMQGYDGAFSDHVQRYEELAQENQLRAAHLQLDTVDFNGKEILDIGGGTGVLSFIALEKGAKRVICGDISQNMLKKAKQNARMAGYEDDQIAFRQLDAENLSFENNSFDVAMAGMAFGLYPNPQKAVDEMARVTRPNGLVSVGAHGIEHYWEAIDATLSACTKRYVLGYRIEFWPYTDLQVERMAVKAGLINNGTSRTIWRNDSASGGEMCDFFTAVTAAFRYAKYPKDKVKPESEKIRKYFEDKGLKRITDDVIFVYGNKSV
jgi:ubiquinone/menaquinone biosynthesis C-methylase UbiE